MYKIAICDDSEKAISQLKRLIEDTLDIEYYVIGFNHEQEFLKALNNREKFDIILLDIILKDDLGVNVAKVINDCLPRASIIFISHTTEYVQEMYESNHLYFLKKPICSDKFEIAMDKALKQQEIQFLIIKKKGQILKIFMNDILFLESCARQIKIYSIDGLEEHYIKLSEIEKQLSEHNFARCHKSYIVNLNHVSRIDKTNIILNNNVVLPISKGFAKEFKDKIANYFLKEGNIYD